MKDTHEYAMIEEFYGDRTAKRSGVRLMNHIDEGLAIMEELDSPYDAKAAFCLHPLFQADAELMTVGCRYMTDWSRDAEAMPILLVMEYRARANAVLSDKVYGYLTGQGLFVSPKADPGPIPEVRDMLIADKVQNRKDFEAHHKGKHARSDALDFYFKHWLEVLGVSEDRYQALCRVIA